MSNADASFKQNIELFLLKNIIDFTPSFALNISNLALPGILQLADPTFCKPVRCDVPLSKRVSLFQDNTRLSFGAPAAGAHYPLFRVWTLMSVELDIK
ncbi:hypothetical protein TNCV_4019701 [Trichonephila clavipes]|nr:hypothetical protein TNCV_4019701 [Trichonephila clavipes]